METLRVKYSKLRATSESVIEFVKNNYWWEKDSNLRTALEDDLGISGDDGWELMDRFSKKFNVDISDFKFQRFFSPEVNNSSFLLLIPAFVISLIVGVVKYSLIIIIYLFNRRITDRIMQFHARSIFEAACKNMEPEDRGVLKIEDLVTSAVCGKFKQRHEVRFELVKG